MFGKEEEHLQQLNTGTGLNLPSQLGQSGYALHILNQLIPSRPVVCQLLHASCFGLDLVLIISK